MCKLSAIEVYMSTLLFLLVQPFRKHRGWITSDAIPWRHSDVIIPAQAMHLGMWVLPTL